MESPLDLYHQLRKAHTDSEKAIIMGKIHADLQSRGYVRSPEGNWVKPSDISRIGLGYDQDGHPVVKDKEMFSAYRKQREAKYEESRKRKQLDAEVTASLVRWAELGLLKASEYGHD